jgi:hypothetical protein
MKTKQTKKAIKCPLNRHVLSDLDDTAAALKLGVSVGDTWINICDLKTGIHVEFYFCGTDPDGSQSYVTATYTFENKLTDFDFHLPSETRSFLYYCRKILDEDIKFRKRLKAKKKKGA